MDFPNYTLKDRPVKYGAGPGCVHQVVPGVLVPGQAISQGRLTSPSLSS